MTAHYVVNEQARHGIGIFFMCTLTAQSIIKCSCHSASHAVETTLLLQTEADQQYCIAKLPVKSPQSCKSDNFAPIFRD